jgi:hypothetical protein
LPPSTRFQDASAGYGVDQQNNLNVSHYDSVADKTINWTYDSQAGTATQPSGVAHNTAQRYNRNDDSAGVQGGFISGYSSSSRSFLPIGGGDITVAAELTNLPTWLNSNYDFTIPGPANPSNPYWSAWHVVGGVQVDEITIDEDGFVLSNQIVVDLRLDSLVLQNTSQTILTGSDSFTPKVNNKVYYDLLVQLSAETVVQNVNNMGIVSALTTPLEIGSWSNPLDAPVVLNAVVDQQVVPIPGTLVLLLSGVGGLTLVRRRLSLKS